MREVRLRFETRAVVCRCRSFIKRLAGMGIDSVHLMEFAFGAL